MNDTPKSKTLLGVVSDTHIPEETTLPEQMMADFKKVDMILHLGDFCNIETYKAFQKIAPLIAVLGNCDGYEMRTLIPEKKRLEVQGFNVGLIHGSGPPNNIEKRAFKAFANMDIVLFGHSHIPYCEMVDGTLLFNPGSPTLNRDRSTGTYGIIELGESISPRIVEIER